MLANFILGIETISRKIPLNQIWLQVYPPPGTQGSSCQITNDHSYGYVRSGRKLGSLVCLKTFQGSSNSKSTKKIQDPLRRPPNIVGREAGFTTLFGTFDHVTC